MTIFFEPKHGDTYRDDNIVIGHYNSFAIVKNEENQLFYLYARENEAPIGTVIENEYLTPIENLLLSEQRKIRQIFGEGLDE